MAGTQMYGWDSDNKRWVKLKLDSDGSIHVVGYVDKLSDIGDVIVAGIADGMGIYWDNANSQWKVKQFLPLAGGTLTGNLTIGADGLKIILSNDAVMQLGTLDGSPTIRGGREAYPEMMIVQPKGGNEVGEIMIMPSGTLTQAYLCLHNSSSLVDYGYIDLVLVGDDVHLWPFAVGEGVLPIKFYHHMHVIPYTRYIHDLGESGLEWGSIYAQRHQIKQPLTADHTWSGLTTSMTAGTALTIGQAVYVGGDSKMEKAVATGVATMPAIALATGTIAENATGEFLMQGFFRDDTWNWTIGGLLYIDEDTAGALTQALPAVAGEYVQVVGVAITADIIHFNPSYELVKVS